MKRRVMIAKRCRTSRRSCFSTSRPPASMSNAQGMWKWCGRCRPPAYHHPDTHYMKRPRKWPPVGLHKGEIVLVEERPT